MSGNTEYKAYMTREKMQTDYCMPRFQFDEHTMDELEDNETKFYMFMTTII